MTALAAILGASVGYLIGRHIGREQGIDMAIRMFQLADEQEFVTEQRKVAELQ